MFQGTENSKAVSVEGWVYVYAHIYALRVETTGLLI